MAIVKPSGEDPERHSEAETYRCSLCWEEFDGPIELMRHEALEEATTYVID